MKTQILTISIIASLIFSSCCDNKPKEEAKPNVTTLPVEVTTKVEEVAYTVAKNYFINNNVTQLDQVKIETSEKFKQVFGMATTMGKEGKPTEINFDKQYVIAVVLPETSQMTTLEPVSLQKNEQNQITFTYKTIVGEKQTYTMRPSLAIIVDKTVEGEIILKEVNK